MSEERRHLAKAFYKKFEAIDDSLWTTESFTNGAKYCALGHLGCRKRFGGITDEGHQLSTILGGHPSVVANINDGHLPEYPQPTPKARILAALKDIIRQ